MKDYKEIIDKLKYDDKGLIVAIAQDYRTGKVLMQAYMNSESLAMTIESGYATYYSRSRSKLWKKGESSGHTQQVIDILYDCDSDAILLQVEQIGNACHTNNPTCFYRQLVEMPTYPDYKIINEVVKVIKERKLNPVEGSYTNYLFDKGAEKICKKIGEEASESIIAAIKGDKAELTLELSDLLYHSLVLMEYQGIELEDIYSAMMAREGKPPHPKYKNS